MKINTTSILLLFGSFLFLIQCSPSKSPEGPYFGNGVHNGWADQNAAVIWTRLTKTPDGNAEGKQFLVLSKEEVDSLDENGNEEAIHHAQIPEGFSLEQMIGACPGMEGEVRLSYFPFKHPEKRINLQWTLVDPKRNYTKQWKLENLQPGTKYELKLEARFNNNTGISDELKGAFLTPPESHTANDINFAVVSCHDYIRKDTSTGHKIYQALLESSPDFYVHTGDIEYYDKPLPYAMTEELMYFKWDRLFALPLQRKFWSQHTTYFMKDDHDALKNDAWPGSTYGTVTWNRGLQIFDKEQFPSNDKPYKTIRWGKHLQIWLTEGRNFRSKNTDPDGPGKSIWGMDQKAWLFRTLKESDVTFKVLISNDPILGPDRQNKHDNYSNDNWKYEGDEIRNFLNDLGNVYICNGDRHWQYVTHFEGTNLWEFSCGAGSDIHAGGWPASDKRPEHRFLRVMGGFLNVHVEEKEGNPFITFEHCDVDGNVVHTEDFGN